MKQQDRSACGPWSSDILKPYMPHDGSDPISLFLIKYIIPFYDRIVRPTSVCRHHQEETKLAFTPDVLDTLRSLHVKIRILAGILERAKSATTGLCKNA